MKKKINLDTYRIIAALLIIGIHTYPFTSISKNLDFIFTHVIFRIAVPFFLMLTGYFVLPTIIKDKEKLKKYTKKILKIYIISIIIYIPINIYGGLLKEINIIEIFKMIFINGTMYHLWYFPGLIMGIWLTYYIIKKTNKKNTLLILILLYIIGLLGDSYYELTEQIHFLKNIYKIIFIIFDYTRNGIFYVPIFLYLGYITKEKTNTTKIKNNIILTIIFLILMILEGITLYYFEIQKHDSMYAFLPLLMYNLFLTITYKNNTQNKKLRNISTIIYIIHPLFIIITRLIGKILNIEKILIENSIVHYITVSLLSITFSITIIKLKTYIKTRNKLLTKQS